MFSFQIKIKFNTSVIIATRWNGIKLCRNESACDRSKWNARRNCDFVLCHRSNWQITKFFKLPTNRLRASWTTMTTTDEKKHAHDAKNATKFSLLHINFNGTAKKRKKANGKNVFIACNHLENNKQCARLGCREPCIANNGPIEIYVINLPHQLKWNERTENDERINNRWLAGWLG